MYNNRTKAFKTWSLFHDNTRKDLNSPLGVFQQGWMATKFYGLTIVQQVVIIFVKSLRQDKKIKG